MMKISELKINQGSVEIEGSVKNIGDTRTFNKYGRDLKVANAIVEDESGNIKLSLWNDDILKVKEGDKIKIVNGYVSEFNGIKQISTGKFGKLEVVGAPSEGSSAGSAEKPKASSKKKVEIAEEAF